MVYLAVSHIPIKKDQDRTACLENKLVICDGIGEFKDSELAAQILIEYISFSEHGEIPEIIGYISQAQKKIYNETIEGGTTLICASIDERTDITKIKLAYLGNGSIIHFHGNFGELQPLEGAAHNIYRYSNLLIPHVDKDGTLLKHVSHHSHPNDLIPTFIELSLTGTNGDIILILTDGINSLEDEIIIQDEHKRTWRHQSENTFFIVNSLHKWLKTHHNSLTNISLDEFIKNTLNRMKELGKLEDDASIGIILTDEVLTYYQKLND